MTHASSSVDGAGQVPLEMFIGRHSLDTVHSLVLVQGLDPCRR